MSKEFYRVAQSNESTLMVVDALNLAFRWKHAKSTEFVSDYIKVVESLQKSYKAGKVIIVCDQGSSSYRKALYPEYKANRKEKQEQQTEQEKAEFEAFFAEFNSTMLAIQAEGKFPLLRFQGVEADDLAAYITKKAYNYGITDIWLISSDKDWDTLIDTHVSRFSYVTRKETTLANWSTHYDCEHPTEYISIKCLNGDTGDNITGVKGIGPKRASDLIKEYGSAFDIAAAIPIASKYKYIQELNNSKELILRNYRLMDLITYCEEAIGDNLYEVDQVLGTYLPLAPAKDSWINNTEQVKDI